MAGPVRAVAPAPAGQQQRGGNIAQQTMQRLQMCSQQPALARIPHQGMRHAARPASSCSRCAPGNPSCTHHSDISRSAGSMPASAATDSLLASADTPPTASKLHSRVAQASRCVGDRMASGHGSVHPPYPRQCKMPAQRHLASQPSACRPSHAQLCPAHESCCTVCRRT